MEAVWIGLDEELYEVDLSTAHRRQLMAVLCPFIAHGRVIAAEHGDEGVDEEPATRPPRQPKHPSPPGRPRRAAQAVTRARTVSPAAPYEHPDYPWFPFHRVERHLAAKVQTWAAEQGIAMPDLGPPRAVLRAYYRREALDARSAGELSMP